MKRGLTGLKSAGLLNMAVWIGTGIALASVSQTEREIVGSGDFDGDGRQDVVILDKASGKYRLGYQEADGSILWISHRKSTVEGVTGMTVGRFLKPGEDALIVSAADANEVSLVGPGTRGVPAEPEPMFVDVLGPNVCVGIDIGGDGNSELDDLFLTSIYNDPKPNRTTLLRNDDGVIEEVIDEMDDDAQLVDPNRVRLAEGGQGYVAGMWEGEESSTFQLQDLSGGQAEVAARITGLDKGTAYVVGRFSGGASLEVVFYEPGKNAISVAQAGSSETPSKTFDLGKPIKQVVPVLGKPTAHFLALFGDGESATFFGFDARSAPKAALTIEPEFGDLIFTAIQVGQSVQVFSGPDYSKFSTHVQPFALAGAKLEPGLRAKLPGLQDTDDTTVPAIHERIVAELEKQGVNSAADMKAYTTKIPGTQVEFTMLPIPGGEYVMGSPEGEAGRREDEGPRQKVKISPFWMGKFELTWNEYELFMYPDDEKKLRDDYPTEAYVNEVSDAVTRPSKPYTEMSFGMGRDGYPAICMTQHAANKYCHWLSAKTGHFYRLPTEAEWEYACRAGTTTAYSFGDDASQIEDYAWFEDNGDFKYQKVGKKKPNPWGLYDIHGNVWEYCIDQYLDRYEEVRGVAINPWVKATKPYPHVARGGSYDDPPDELRSAARRASDPSWKMRDPQLPKSIWWFSDAQFVGFRLVRPLEVPSPERMVNFWSSGVEKEEDF